VAEIIILGAGLTGLSAAYHLEQNNFFDYKIFEKNDRPGGLLQSVQHEGFTFDHTGHLLHISDPYFRSFLDTVAEISNFNLVERNAAIYSHNVFTDYPFQMNLFGLPVNVIAECLEGYLQRKTTLRTPQNFHDWVLKYFGKGFGKHFFFPYNSKLLATDIKKIHPSWTGRFVPQTNLAAILKGALEKKPARGIGYNSSFYYPKAGGIEFIIKQIHSKLLNKALVNYQAEYIDTTSKTVYFQNGYQEKYQQLITTLPLDTLLSKIKEPTNSFIKNAEAKLFCNSVVNINLGFPGDKLSDYHWVYLPEKKYLPYRIGFWQNICKSSVPQGTSAIYGEFSFRKERVTAKQKVNLIERAIDASLKLLNRNRNDILAQKILHLDHAYVLYDQWREKNLAQLLTALAAQSVHSIGRFGEWKYSSMQEAVLDGKKVAQTVLSNQSVRKSNTPVMNEKKIVIKQSNV
jgi:protoporphyrinogen oxidase